MTLVGIVTNWLAKILAGFVLGSVVVCAAFADDFQLSLPQGPDDTVALALPDGIAGEPAEVLRVFVGSTVECCDAKVPVAGKYDIENNVLSFTPMFGFSAGVDYVAQVRGAHGNELTSFNIASDIAPTPAAVSQIYPSGNILPENILRFYIHFSVPMKPGVAFDYIKLRDATGAVDEAAFIRFKQELWNDDRTRLTVLVDPGRIKREVATNRELGPALIAGNHYTLSVDEGWPSISGQSELASFSKSFGVSAALRSRPDVRFWQSNSPCHGTTEPLELRFDRPFDRHLLEKDIHVIGRDQTKIAGAIKIGADERSWRFTPNEPWSTDEVQVVASAKLEDVAANNFHDLLDHVQINGANEATSTILPIKLKSCGLE